MSTNDPFSPENLLNLFGIKLRPIGETSCSDTCENCGEDTTEDMAPFMIGRKELFLCPCCTEKQRNENPRSEVL